MTALHRRRGLVCRAGGERVQGWWAVSYAALWLVVVLLCVIVVALARQIGTLHLRLGPRGALEMDAEGPPLGEAPPPIEAVALGGERTAIGGPGDGRLLLFVSPGCLVCESVLPGLEPVAAAAGMTPIVIVELDPEEARVAFSPRSARVPVIAGVEVVRAYDVPGTPYVVVLDAGGVVRAKGTPNSLEEMEGLVDSARRRMAEAASGAR
jgi:methylamine dehydrogenase accessory protein MauD